jgi:N-acetylgalactosamine-N,N'-diacetylbacillosaminyl-diphospho-undecaprenol 4-alpha-N-acetylgalactosaminyltransferase
LKQVTLFINSLTSGGAERVLSVIIHGLTQEGIKVNLLCIENDNAYTLPNEVQVTHLSNLSKDDNALKKILYLPIVALRLKKYVKANNIPLVQSHIYRANFSNILAKLFGAGHQAQVVEVTSINNLRQGSFAKKINFQLVKLLYKHADLVIFKAKKMKEEFLKNFPNTQHYKVINNPYDIEKIQTLAKKHGFQHFSFDTKKQYLITVGRLSAEKRHITLINVLKKLKASTELIIIGEGIERVRLEQQAKESGLSSRVHFLGKQSNPFQYVQKADIFILSSEGEGFPNVIVESMICGTPVISTDCISGPREILSPKSDINHQLKSHIELAPNGILYPVDDEKALLEAINFLTKNQRQQNIYQKNGLLKSQEYSLENIIQQYKEVLCVAL